MGNNLRVIAKQLARRLSPVKQLLDSRQLLLDERNDVIAKRARLTETCERLENEVNHLRNEVQRLHDRIGLFGAEPPFVPNGHFYSPVPSLAEMHRDEERIFCPVPRTLPGIELRESEQLALLDRFSANYGDLPFTDNKKDGLRYYFVNPAYGYSDAIFLNLMIRYVRPKRIVEVGSGFSSCMTLDTNEIWFNNSIDCTFIEPYPDLLYSLIKEDDRKRIQVLVSRVQDVDLTLLNALESGDILFIDSTHVSKIGSDVNRIMFEILPLLSSGVFVHFHDIFYPFEYPKAWANEGRAWNEAYLLRAFLQSNSEFEIVLFNTFLEHFHLDFFKKHMPLCLKNTGASIWLRKL